MKKKGIVYQVTNKVSGRVYVGRTQKTTDLFVLVKQHLLYQYKYCEFLQDMLRLGEHNFEFKILCEGFSNELRDFKKNYLKILLQNSVILYNKPKRNDDFKEKLRNTKKGSSHSEATKEKMSRQRRLRPVKYCPNTRKLLALPKSDYGKIMQYDLNGCFIKEWNDVKEVVLSIGGSATAIINALKGRAKTSNGFIWKYKFDGL